MEIDRRQAVRAVNFMLTVVGLLVIAGAMGVMIAIAARAAPDSAPEAREYFYRLAWIAAAMLGLALVMLTWTVSRYLRRRSRESRHEPTPYVDAWAEAGRRARVDDEDEDDPDEA